MPETLLSQYGPVAFGVVAVLLLWRVIIAPELAASRETGKVNAAALQAAAQDMRAAADANRSSAEVNKIAAQMLAVAANRLGVPAQAIGLEVGRGIEGPR